MPDTTTPAQLGVHEWRRELERLARDAEAAGDDAPLAERQRLASAAFSLLWLSWSPSVVARSCRLSGRLGEPLLADPGPLDQQLLQSFGARTAALRSVGALPRPIKGVVVEVGPPGSFLEEPAEVFPGPGPGREPQPQAEPLQPDPPVAEPTPAPRLELPAVTHQPSPPTGWQPWTPPAPAAPATPTREKRALRPASERIRPRPEAPPEPAAPPEPVAAPEPPAPDLPPDWQPEPAPEPAPTSWPEVPPNWLKAGEASEVLGITREQLHRMRQAGDTGSWGIHWIQCGPKSFYFSPQIVEKLESELVAPGLDDLLSTVRE
jgi:hypothetical protein